MSDPEVVKTLENPSIESQLLERALEEIEKAQKSNEFISRLGTEIRSLSNQLFNIQNELRDLTKDKNLKVPINKPKDDNEQNQSSKENPIRIKDALETVPVFDGYRPSIFQFLRACERAKAMLSPSQEQWLVKLLTNKLRGHAFMAIEDSNMNTVEEFGNKLKLMFGPQKSVNQYKGELGNIFKKPNETILDYISRIKDLRLAIMDGERILYPDDMNPSFSTINSDVAEAFVNGLPSDVKIRLQLEGYRSLDDCYANAIKISKQIQLEEERIKQFTPNNRDRRNFSQPSNRYPPSNNQYQQNQNRPPQNRYQPPAAQDNRNRPRWQNNSYPTNNTNNYNKNYNNGSRFNNQPGASNPPVTCTYCKKLGHVIKDCYKFKAKVESGEIVPYSQQKSGNGGPSPGNNDAPRGVNPTERRTVMKITPTTSKTTPVGAARSTPSNQDNTSQRPDFPQEKTTNKEETDEEEINLGESSIFA